MGPDDCEDCCSTCCCITCGTVCCCRPMRKTTRIKILWVWLLVLSGTSAVILGCVVYAPFKMLASPSDMIPIRDHVHFLFCEEVTIVSPGLQFNGYVISGDLKIDQTRAKHYSQRTALFLGERTYDYLAFYLLHQSNVVLRHCTKQFLTFTVIIGRANFETWKKYQYCDNCYFDQSFLQPEDSCKDVDSYGRFTLDALVEDEYFIIYSSENYVNDWVDINIEIDHTLYNMQNATTSCTDATQCNIILDGPDDTAVIWVMDYDYDLGRYNHPEFSVKCVPRIWAYLLIHGFPVLLIGVCLSILIQRTCRDPGDCSFNIQNERTPLLYSAAVLPPSYSTVLREPPKYEDIVRSCEPPTYPEALAGLETGQNVIGYPSYTTSENAVAHPTRTNNEHNLVSSISLQNENDGLQAVFCLNTSDMTSSSETQEREAQSPPICSNQLSAT